jgi:hypothetical protein
VGLVNQQKVIVMNVHKLLGCDKTDLSKVCSKTPVEIWRGEAIPEHDDQSSLFQDCPRCGRTYPNTYRKPDSIWYKITLFLIIVMSTWFFLGLGKMKFLPKSEPSWVDAAARGVGVVLYKVLWVK